jgi:hypothetical protein
VPDYRFRDHGFLRDGTKILAAIGNPIVYTYLDGWRRLQTMVAMSGSAR